MKPQPTATRPTSYQAQFGALGTEPASIAEAPTLREIVAHLHALRLPSLANVSVEASIPQWILPITVPFECYSYLREGKQVLQPLEAVAEHWDFPAPNTYFALDWKRGVYVEAPTLTLLVEHLHATGSSFVDSRAMKIGARFMQETAEATDVAAADVVPVPLSLLCHDYFPEDDEEIEETEQESAGDVRASNDPQGFSQCSILPLEAELLPTELVEPHFLFAAKLRNRRRLRELCLDELGADLENLF